MVDYNSLRSSQTLTGMFTPSKLMSSIGFDDDDDCQRFYVIRVGPQQVQQLVVLTLHEGVRDIELLDLLSAESDCSMVAKSSAERHQLKHTALQPSSSDDCLLILQTTTSTSVKFPTAALRTQFVEQFATLKRSSVGEGIVRQPSGNIGPQGMEASSETSVMFDRESVQFSRHTEISKQVVLGTGSFAVVFKSTDRLTGRPIAVKSIRKDFRFSEQAVQAYNREIHRMKSLKHKHIVKYLDCTYEMAGGVLQEMFIMLEYMSGGSLSGLLACLHSHAPPLFLPDR